MILILDNSFFGISFGGGLVWKNSGKTGRAKCCVLYDKTKHTETALKRTIQEGLKGEELPEGRAFPGEGEPLKSAYCVSLAFSF